jgi:hypothetical protein
MRLFTLLILLPVPAAAWNFSATPMCTLTHQAETAEIAITYDPDKPEYALFITLRDGTWDDAPTFGMAFAGGRRIDLTTRQHDLSADGATLSVRDSGFGNVLDGLEFNAAVFSTSGGTVVQADLDGAAAAVQAFRACPDTAPALS